MECRVVTRGGQQREVSGNLGADTVTLIRSAVRGLLRVADAELAAVLRAVLERDDDYAVLR